MSENAPVPPQINYQAPFERSSAQSRVGIVSFWLSLVALVGFAAKIFIAFVVVKPYITAMTSAFAATTMTSSMVMPPPALMSNFVMWSIVSLICAGLALAFGVAALVTGIIGLSQKSYARRYALLGTIIAGVSMLGSCVG